MPCNCIVDKPLYPKNEEWGPSVWWMIHALAEKAGRQTNLITHGDELRAWPLFVKELPGLLPCPYCRDHLQSYLKQHPFVLPDDTYLWKTYIPQYFYDLHNSVNHRLGKPAFSRESLSETYRDSGRMRDVFATVEKVVDRAVKQGGMSLFNYRAWLKQFNLLRAAIL